MSSIGIPSSILERVLRTLLRGKHFLLGDLLRSTQQKRGMLLQDTVVTAHGCSRLSSPFVAGPLELAIDRRKRYRVVRMDFEVADRLSNSNASPIATSTTDMETERGIRSENEGYSSQTEAEEEEPKNRSFFFGKKERIDLLSAMLGERMRGEWKRHSLFTLRHYGNSSPSTRSRSGGSGVTHFSECRTFFSRTLSLLSFSANSRTESSTSMRSSQLHQVMASLRWNVLLRKWTGQMSRHVSYCLVALRRCYYLVLFSHKRIEMAYCTTTV